MDNGEPDGPVIDDWALDCVERGAEGDISTFVAIYTSEVAKEVAWNDGARVTVSIDPLPGKGVPPVERTFKAVFSKEGIEMIAFWDDGIHFEAE